MTFDKEHDVRKRHHIFGSFADAAGYDRHAWGALTRLRERIVTDVATAGLPSGSRVLDVGTGPGRLPLAIAARLPHLRVDAVDLEPRMIEYARSRPDAARVTFTVVESPTGVPVTAWIRSFAEAIFLPPSEVMMS